MTVSKSERLREYLRVGPFMIVWLHAREFKRRVRPAPLDATHQMPQRYGIEQLHRKVNTQPDLARLYFSLAVVWLDDPSTAAARKALACARSARALGFEGEERLLLYESAAIARLGAGRAAATRVASIDAGELISAEVEVLQRVLTGIGTSSGEPSDHAAHTEPAPVAALAPGSMVVFSDPDARTARWRPDAVYLLASPEVTGLGPMLVARLGLTFDVAIGSFHDRAEALAAGVVAHTWIDV